VAGIWLFVVLPTLPPHPSSGTCSQIGVRAEDLGHSEVHEAQERSAVEKAADLHDLVFPTMVCLVSLLGTITAPLAAVPAY
jgi:hypothetical protein